MTRTRTLVSVLLGILAAASVSSAAPLLQQIAYSGYLRDGLGPINSPKDLTFKIYNTPDVDGTLPLWTEVQAGVVFTDGEFTVNLGSVTPFAAPLDFYANTQYWLGITIGAGTELTPRKKLLFVPYAINSQIESRSSDPASPATGQMWLIVP